jgi:hypothetical protein
LFKQPPAASRSSDISETNVVAKVTDATGSVLKGLKMQWTAARQPCSPLQKALYQQGRRQDFERGVVFSKITDFHGQFQRFVLSMIFSVQRIFTINFFSPNGGPPPHVIEPDLLKHSC